MTTTNINFQWSRAYSKTSGNPAGYECTDGKIRQVGRGLQPSSPFKNDALYLEFAQLDGSPAACVSFAERWGLLSKPAKSSTLPSEGLPFWRGEIKRMRTLISMLPRVVKVANSRGTFARVGRIDVLLVPGSGPNAVPILVMEPGTLLDAMNLQLAQFVAGGNSILTCEQCRQLFEAGRGVRRSIAKFCSDKCRGRHHYERRIGK